MSKIKVNEIENRTGSTLTLGKSGTTIQLACGATQTGFGRSGSVNWCTTAKTTPFTAENGKGYFVNTTSGTVTVTLPASPSGGDIVAIKDYARTFATNKVVVARNGSNMDGSAACTNLTATGTSATLVFVDATKGWQFVNDDATASAGGLFMAATGGNTVATCGDFKIHTFTSSGTFCISCAGNSGGNNQMEYLVVAGGGSGGSENGQSVAGGGGGAGGFRFASPSLAPGANTFPAKPLAAPTTLTASAGAIPVTVGAGGAIDPVGTNAGSPSVFSTITSTGGGGGAFTGAPGPSGLRGGNPGGSGGGASHGTSYPGPAGGAGNTPPVSPPQGNPGGGLIGGSTYLGGGGGGALAAGGGAPSSAAGPGGVGGGFPTAFGLNGDTNPSPGDAFRYFSGGGGGGGSSNRPETGPAGTGSLGGGAAGGAGQNPAPANATANTGGGGGGAGNEFPNPGTPLTGSAGGSGIVVIRYRFQ